MGKSGLNIKEKKEVKKMIADATSMALGDMAEYLNYLNDRIIALEKTQGINAPAYSENEVAVHHKFPDNKKEDE